MESFHLTKGKRISTIYWVLCRKTLNGAQQLTVLSYQQHLCPSMQYYPSNHPCSLCILYAWPPSCVVAGSCLRYFHFCSFFLPFVCNKIDRHGEGDEGEGSTHEFSISRFSFPDRDYFSCISEPGGILRPEELLLHPT